MAAYGFASYRDGLMCFCFRRRPETDDHPDRQIIELTAPVFDCEATLGECAPLDRQESLGVVLCPNGRRLLVSELSGSIEPGLLRHVGSGETYRHLEQLALSHCHVAL